MKKLFTLFFFVVCFFNSRAQNGCCDNLAPTFYVDFTGANAGTQWTSPPIARQNTVCCSGTLRCVQFIIETDSNTCGVTFYRGGGPDPGSYDLQMCCGGQLAQYDTTYIKPGTHSLMFCKPGSILNPYSITSIQSCNGFPTADTLCALNCSLITKTNNDSQPKTISVYPNPANDKLTVRLSETQKEKTSFQIYDITGREVSPQSEITYHKSEIDISSLQAGVYFLKINEGENALVKRFLKE